MTQSASTWDQFTATVHAADGARFVASASTAVALEERVANYVRERCDDVLWPSAAAEVHSLIESGQPHAAIETYFANVGQRWDAEWLELEGQATNARPVLVSEHALHGAGQHLSY